MEEGTCKGISSSGAQYSKGLLVLFVIWLKMLKSMFTINPFFWKVEKDIYSTVP